MSFGSISDPAHRDMAIAYNLVGSTIGTGEGGIPLYRMKVLVQRRVCQSSEPPVCLRAFRCDTRLLAAMPGDPDQGRQGAKPAWGAFFPVASGAHHRRGAPCRRRDGAAIPLNNEDIYSIEDLNAVIYKLRQLNPAARIG